MSSSFGTTMSADHLDLAWTSPLIDRGEIVGKAHGATGIIYTGQFPHEHETVLISGVALIARLWPQASAKNQSVPGSYMYLNNSRAVRESWPKNQS